MPSDQTRGEDAQKGADSGDIKSGDAEPNPGAQQEGGDAAEPMTDDGATKPGPGEPADGES